MATLAVYKTDLDGGKPTFVTAAAGGDDFVNGGNTMLVVKNGGTGSITVSIAAQKPCNYGIDHDISVSISNADESWIGPFPTYWYNDATNKVNVTYSGVTTVTIAAVEVA